MMKYCLSFFLIIISSISVAQVTTTIQWKKSQTYSSGDTIYYDPARKLDWSDFKGRPDKNSVAAAITESGFGYRMSMQHLNGRTNIIITVFCYFNNRKSWVKPEMDNSYALTHEQHHFDITYINACVFIKKLKEATLTEANYASLVDFIHDECYYALEKMQNEYDGQTSNGRIKKQQLDWNKKIDKLLTELITD